MDEKTFKTFAKRIGNLVVNKHFKLLFMISEKKDMLDLLLLKTILDNHLGIVMRI